MNIAFQSRLIMTAMSVRAVRDNNYIEDINMLKSCPYCGKIHARDYICPYKPQYSKHNAQIDRFRNSKAWKLKRIEIAQRDLHMCRLCAIGYDSQPAKYNGDISVHHITPLAEDYSKRLESDNLISLCSYHHELAENGKIPRTTLRELTKIPPLPFGLNIL